MPEHDRSAFMREALHLAAESVELGGGPFGAVVVKDGRIIASARNRVTETGDPTAHAEVLAIREACRSVGSHQLTGCEIYCSGEPCPMCLGAIYWARPGAVFFANHRADAAAAGFDDSFIYEEIARTLPERRLRMGRIELEDAGEPYRRWLARPDRIEY